MLPILGEFTIGDWAVTVHAYGTFLVIAALAALGLFVRGAVGVGMAPREAAALFACALVAGLAGARILDVALNIPRFAEDPEAALLLEPRSFALYGGLTGALAVGVGWLRARGRRVAPLADASVPAVAVGIALLRVGCFLNGCCTGIATDLPTAVEFPTRQTGFAKDLVTGAIPLFGKVTANSPVHPTQLYELAAALLLALGATIAARRGGPAGTRALLFAAGFLVFRAADQSLRAEGAGATLDTATLVGSYAAAAVVAAVVLAWALARERAGGSRPAEAIAA